MSAIPQTNVASEAWQPGFLQLLPAVRTHAQIQFRRLPAPHRDEAVQEAIAAACLTYQLAAAQGKLHVVRPATLANFAVRHVRQGRHVGGKMDAARDVLSPRCQRRHRVQVQDYPHESTEQRRTDWRQVALADRKTSVADLAAFRIDFANWLRTLNRRDRKIIAAFTSGDGTYAVARRFRLCPSGISNLRRRYQHHWQRYQGEAA